MTPIMRRFCLAWAVLMLSTASVASPCPSEKLRIGYEPWLPYTYQALDGSYTGLDLDLIRLVLTRLGCRYEFVERPWKRLLLEIERGNLHLTGGASYTDERNVWGTFSTPYRDERVVLLVRALDAEQYGAVTSLTEFLNRGFTLGHTRDYFYGDEFEQVSHMAAFAALIQPGSDDLANLKKLQHGRMDGFLTDPFSASSAIRVHLLAFDIKPLLTVYRSDIHVLFSRRSVEPELVDAFNAEIDRMRQAGELDGLLNSYLQTR